MNFITIFEELDKLYEEDASKATAKTEPEEVKEACAKEALIEAAEDSIEDEIAVEEETPETEALVDEAEIEIVDDEPKQVILECEKCGALVIKADTAVVIDEETDLANIEDECEFCEETSGYKIVGIVAPYEAESEDTEEASIEEPVEEPLEEPVDDMVVEESVESSAAEADEPIEEDLADWYRKKFDKPASSDVQGSWEDRLEYLYCELSDPNLDANKKAKLRITSLGSFWPFLVLSTTSTTSSSSIAISERNLFSLIVRTRMVTQIAMNSATAIISG